LKYVKDRIYREIKSILHSVVREETIGCIEKTIGCFSATSTLLKIETKAEKN